VTPLRLTTWFRKRMLALVLLVTVPMAAAAPIAFFIQKRLELLSEARGKAAQVAEVVRTAVDERPRLWRHVAVLLYTRLTLALMVVRDISVAPLKQRITRRLLGQAITSGADVSTGGRVDLRLTQADLGRMLGTSRSRVNGALKHLEDDGLIEVGYRTISLLDMAKLRAVAGPEIFSF